MRIANRIISNNVEFSFVYFAFFGFWLFKFANEESKSLAINFIVMFVFARVVFFVGYFIQGLTGIVVVRSASIVINL